MSDEHKKAPSGRRPALRTVLRLARQLLVGMLLVIVTVGILLQIPFVSTFTARTVLSLANPWPGTTTAIGSAGGSWFWSLKLTQVTIVAPTDSLFVSIDTLRASYDLTALFGGALHFREIYLSRPVVRTRFVSDGSPVFLRPFAPDTTRRDTSGGLTVRGDHLHVTNGELILLSRPDSVLHHLQVHEIHLRADSILIKGGIAAVIDTLHSRIVPNKQPWREIQLGAAGSLGKDFIRVRSLLIASSRSRIEAQGHVPLPFSLVHSLPKTDLKLTASPVSYEDLHLLVPGIGPEGEARIGLAMASQEDSSFGNLTAEFPGGGAVSIQGKLRSAPGQTLGLEITGASKQFSPSGVTGMPDTSDALWTRFSITGTGRSLEDFSGLVGVEVLPSYLAGTGPMKGKVKAEVRQGRIQAECLGEGRTVHVKAEADLAPFESNPSYDVRGLVTVLHSGRSESTLQRLEGFAGRFTLIGQGMSAHAARAHAVIKGKWNGNRYFDALFLDADYNRDTVHATAQLLTATGSLKATVEAVLSGMPEYKVYVPEFRTVSLTVFGDSLPSSELSGSLRAEVRGTSLASLDGKVSFRLDSSEIGNIAVRRMETDISIDRGRFHFTGLGESDAGSISLEGLVNPSADSPDLTLEHFDFRGVNLGKIYGKEDLSSDLNGSVAFQATARSMDDVTRLMRDEVPDGTGAVHASATVRLYDSGLRKQRIHGATIGVTLLDGNLESTVDLQTSAGDFNGGMKTRPFARTLALEVPALKLEHLDIGALAGNDSLHSELTGMVKGAFKGDSLERATGDLSFEFENASTSAVLPARGSLQATMEEGRFSLHSSADFPDGRAALDAGGLLIPGGVQGKLSLDVAFKDSASPGSAAAVPPAGLMMRGSVEGIWGARSETDLRGTLRGGGMRGKFRADTLLCGFSVRGRVLDVDTLRILTNVATVIGGGTLALFDSTAIAPSDLSLAVSVTSLQPLAGVFGLDPALLQSATLSLNASGPPAMTQVHCVTDVNMVSSGELALASLHGSIDSRWGPSAVLRSIHGSADVGGLHYGPLTLASASVTLRSAENIYDITGLIELERGSTIRLVGSVHDDADSLTVLIDSLVARSPKETWHLDRQASIIYGPRIVVRDFALHSGARDLVVEGVLDPKGEQDFTVSSDSLNVGNIGELLGRPGLDGLIFYKFHVGGPAVSARAVGDISISLRNGAVDLGGMSARLDWGPRSLEIRGIVEQPEGGKLDAIAQLPIRLPLPGRSVEGIPELPETSEADSLNVLLNAERFSLDFIKPVFSPKTVSAFSGTLTANIHVAGTLGSVVADGEASIDEGLVGIAPLGVVYNGIQIRCTAAGKDLKIEDAKVVSAEGTLQLSGLVSLRNPTKPALDLKMSFERFVAIQTSDIKACVSGALLLKGGMSEPVVTGNLVVNDSYFVLPEAGRLDSVESVELTAEDYAMLQRYFGYHQQVTVIEKGRSTIEPTLDLTVTMEKNTWIRKRRNPTLAIELLGSVRLDRPAEGSPRIIGTMRCPAGRSYVGQFGRQFELTEGEIVFKGPLAETDLHINSEYKVPSKGGTGLSEVVIRMKVESNLGRFVFSLTSDPAMDESEILSYLATGQSRTGALANTADQGGLAGSMALEQLVGAAGGLAEGSMPLDVFQIRQDGARGITVVAGNYVNQKTYLGIRQPILFNQGTEDSYYDTRTQYELEYQARPWLFLNLQGGSSRTMLFLKARVAY